jgi:poly-gamma-glutamate synthesis protein (capsule biosynthesis protein)
MREHRTRGFLSLISVHSGDEHVNFPAPDDIAMARMFARDGPYVYYGHHPHVIQGCERLGDAFIAYSLGNFCFDDVYTPKSDLPLIRQSDNNRTGLIVELEVTRTSVTGVGLRTLFAGPDSMTLDVDTARESLAIYSAALNDPRSLYEARRSAGLRTYAAGRKKQRDLNWYLKRLRPASASILLRSRLNRWLYARNVSRYLSNESS